MTAPRWRLSGIPTLGKHRERLRATDWDMIILDEGHYIGNLDSQRTQEIVGCVKDACRAKGVADSGDDIEPLEADRKLVLTGTPYDARTDQLFPLVSFLAPSYWGHSTRQNQREFRQRYYDAGRKQGRNLEDLQERLRRTVMLRRTGDDVIDQVPLGPISRRTVILDPQSQAEKVAVNRAGSMDIPPAEADLTSDPVAFNEMSRALKATAIAKAPQVARYVARASKAEPIVFFSNYPDVLRIVGDELDREGVRNVTIDGSISKAARTKAAADFQDGKADVILLSLATGREGLTLVRSKRAIFNDLSWRPTDLLQAEKRIHRIGQKGDALIEYMVLDGSLDGHQADVMARKIHAMAGGVGLSKSAEALGATPTDTDGDGEPDTDIPPPSRSDLQRRQEECQDADSPEEFRRIARYAASDVDSARSALERAALDAGLPRPEELPDSVDRLEMTGNGRVRAIDDPDSPTMAPPDTPPEVATPEPSLPTPEPLIPDDFGVNEPGDAEPEVPPAYEPDGDTSESTPVRAGSYIDLKPRFRQMDLAARQRAVARYNVALAAFREARAVQEQMERAATPESAAHIYCDWLERRIASMGRRSRVRGNRRDGEAAEALVQFVHDHRTQDSGRPGGRQSFRRQESIGRAVPQPESGLRDRPQAQAVGPATLTRPRKQEPAPRRDRGRFGQGRTPRPYLYVS